MVSKKKILIIFIIVILFFTFFLKTNSGKAITNTNTYTDEQKNLLIRFGITAPLGIDGYDLDSIHALTFLDWRKENLAVPEGIEYIHVLNMRFVAVANDDGIGTLDEAAYQQFLLGLPDLINRNLGEVWIIGNEPDRKVWQDDLTPEKYAERFFDVATIIKNTDSEALVGYGSIVQPTPIRIRYLERSLNRLSELALSMENALGMIDIWTIHAFILNEDYSTGSWGADVPPGFDCSFDCYDAFIIDDFNYAQTYSIDNFKEFINGFRIWLKLNGEQEKPLWITEYGSLFYDWEIACPDCPIPPFPPNEEWPTSSDNIEYMIDTFDFLLNSIDPNIGMPDDESRLVQRWYWYSLNDHLYTFGGSLFDPDNNKVITNQGIAYKQYIEILIGAKIYLPIVSK